MTKLFKVAAGLLSWVLAIPVFAADPASTVSHLAVLQNGFSIRHVRQEVRDGGITRLYTTADDFVDVPTTQIQAIESEEAVPQATAEVVPAPAVPQLIDTASSKHFVDADFIRSVIRAESGFNPRAVSPKGAQGLMQLMPQTALRFGVPNAFEAGANIDAGTRYLRELLVQYHGDAAKALAAYNAGPERVEQYKGVPPYHETRAYVRRVISDYNRAKKAPPKDTNGTPTPADKKK